MRHGACNPPDDHRQFLASWLQVEVGAGTPLARVGSYVEVGGGSPVPAMPMPAGTAQDYLQIGAASPTPQSSRPMLAVHDGGYLNVGGGGGGDYLQIGGDAAPSAVPTLTVSLSTEPPRGSYVEIGGVSPAPPSASMLSPGPRFQW